METLEAGQTDVAPLNPDEQAALDHLFRYHSPDQTAVARMQEIRDNAKRLAESIVRWCPRSADRSAAIRKLREAVMTANAAIVLEGRNLP